MTGVVVVTGLLFLVGSRKIDRRFAVPPETLMLPTDSASLAEGERLSLVLGCADCHAANLAGSEMIDAPMFAVLPATNLTRGAGGVAADYGAEGFERAVRHGIGGAGRALMIMPSADYAHLSDGDVSRLVSYLLQLQPVDNDVGLRTVGPVGRIATAIAPRGLFPAFEIDHEAPHPEEVSRQVTPAFGEYLTRPCRGCHGVDLRGGRVPGAGSAAPPAGRLIPDAEGLAGWTDADFMRALREGIRPDGTTLDPAMPWPTFSLHTDEELLAMWAHLTARAAAGSE
jgi:cytochrome c553